MTCWSTSSMNPQFKSETVAAKANSESIFHFFYSFLSLSILWAAIFEKKIQLYEPCFLSKESGSLTLNKSASCFDLVTKSEIYQTAVMSRLGNFPALLVEFIKKVVLGFLQSRSDPGDVLCSQSSQVQSWLTRHQNRLWDHESGRAQTQLLQIQELDQGQEDAGLLVGQRRKAAQSAQAHWSKSNSFILISFKAHG